MNIVQFLIKDIFKKKLRVLLTISGIAVGIGVCVIMLGVGESIKKSFQDAYGSRQIDIIVQETDQLSILLSRVNADIARDYPKSISAIDDTAATLLYLHKSGGTAVPVFGWQEDSFLFDGVEIISGHRPQSGKKEAMAGGAFMRTLEKKHERTVTIKGVTFNVVGAFKSTSPFEQFSLVMPLSDLQKTIKEENKATFINVRLNPANRSEEAINATLKAIETATPSITAMRADAFTQEKTKFIVVGEKFSLLVTIITIIAVALGLINTMVTSGFEKRKFLAILLALGWRKRQIALLFLSEALIVAILGGAAGLFLGFKGMAYIFSMSSIGAFVPVLSVVMMIKITAALLGISLAAAIVPVWINLNLNPVEVIRGE